MWSLFKGNCHWVLPGISLLGNAVVEPIPWWIQTDNCGIQLYCPANCHLKIFYAFRALQHDLNIDAIYSMLLQSSSRGSGKRRHCSLQQVPGEGGSMLLPAFKELFAFFFCILLKLRSLDLSHPASHAATDAHACLSGRAESLAPSQISSLLLMAAEQTLGRLVLNTAITPPAQLWWFCYFHIIPGYCISVPRHSYVFFFCCCFFNLKTILSSGCFAESKNCLTPGRSLLQRAVLETKPEDPSGL